MCAYLYTCICACMYIMYGAMGSLLCCVYTPVTLFSHCTVYNPSNNSCLNFKSTSLTHVTSCTGPHVLTTLTHLVPVSSGTRSDHHLKATFRY